MQQKKANIRDGLDQEQLHLIVNLCAECTTANEPELIFDEQLPPPPQIKQEQPEYEPLVQSVHTTELKDRYSLNAPTAVIHNIHGKCYWN